VAVLGEERWHERVQKMRNDEANLEAWVIRPRYSRHGELHQPRRPRL
jgi:hypothetical protein